MIRSQDRARRVGKWQCRDGGCISQGWLCDSMPGSSKKDCIEACRDLGCISVGGYVILYQDRARRVG